MTILRPITATPLPVVNADRVPVDTNQQANSRNQQPWPSGFDLSMFLFLSGNETPEEETKGEASIQSIAQNVPIAATRPLSNHRAHIPNTPNKCYSVMFGTLTAAAILGFIIITTAYSNDD